MIFPAIDIVRQELVANGLRAVLGNIGEIHNSPGNGGINADIVISLINIAADGGATAPGHPPEPPGGGIPKKPVIPVSLTVLFAAVGGDAGYGLALQALQKIIAIFHAKVVFNHANTPALDMSIDNLLLDMINLPLSEVQDIWSVQGGLYFPSVVYRLQVTPVQPPA